MAVVSTAQPGLPGASELGTGLPVFGTMPQLYADAVNYTAGYLGRRWVSLTVDQAIGGRTRRTHNVPRAGSTSRDTYVPMRLSPLARYMALVVHYTTTSDREGVSDPEPTLTVTVEKLDGTVVDTIEFELDPTPLVGGVADADVVALGANATSPTPEWADTGWEADPAPPSGDTTPRPLLVSTEAGNEVTLHLNPTHCRVLSIHWAEMYELSI